MSHNDTKGVPNWILFLFFGALLAGVGYAIFMQGFLGQSNAQSLRASQGLDFVQPRSVAPPPPRSPAAIASGEKTYQQVCVACHGANREGGAGPSLSDATWLHYDNEVNLGRLIMRGVPGGQTKQPSGTPMPARGGQSISDVQVWEVVYYLSSKNGSIVKDAAP
ncbi:MAG: cytochrome c [Leptospirales bacterium]|nr:cytochrome c [Leptospirales bacterium]